MKNFIAGLIIGIILTTCFFIFYPTVKTPDVAVINTIAQPVPDTSKEKKLLDTAEKMLDNASIRTSGTTQRDSIVAFAKTLIGTPYLYASMDPAKGFDCSGFINYVFNHFKITVPRSSYEFEKIGKKVALDHCRPGDLILFTGTAPEEKNIGHIGIITDISGARPSFIHSSSGKANGVTITSMESTYYQSRFVTVVDVLSP